MNSTNINPNPSKDNLPGIPPTAFNAPNDGLPSNIVTEPGDNFKCTQCGRGFLFKNNLKAHMRTHSRDRRYTCETCGKSFIYKESLKNHMLLHTNELPYQCDICDKKFRDRSNRRKHVKNVHKYLFVNGDINMPLINPGCVGSDAIAAMALAQPKRRRSSKKASQEGGDGQVQGDVKDMTKVVKSRRGRKPKIITTTAPAVRPTTISSATKSVIVSALRHSHTLSSTYPPLPVTIHVPHGSNRAHGHGEERRSVGSHPFPTNYQYQSPPATPAPDLYYQYQQQEQSHAQNVIVYPKPKAVVQEQLHYPPITSTPGPSHLSQEESHYFNARPEYNPQHFNNYPDFASQYQQQQPSPDYRETEYFMEGTNQSSESRESDPSSGGRVTHANSFEEWDQGTPEGHHEQQGYLYSPDPYPLDLQYERYHHWTHAPPTIEPGMDRASNIPDQYYNYERINQESTTLSSNEGMVYSRELSTGEDNHEVFAQFGSSGTHSYRNHDFNYL